MRYLKNIPPLVIIGLLLATYLSTMAAGLTWANHGSDGGDLITAAYTHGIAHPTGYPVYLLLASLFQKLPIGTLAFRTNLLSTVVTILSAVFVYRIVHKVTGDWLPGFLTSLVYAWTPIIWSQAVITEVYALHVCFFSIFIYLILRPVPFDGWLGFVLGVAAGNHVTSILLLPVILIMYSVHSGSTFGGLIKEGMRTSRKIRDFSMILVGMGLGLASYLLLPVRASSASPILWGDLSTVDGFLWMISGQMYVENLLPLSFKSPWATIQYLFSMLRAQFGLFGLIFILLGLPVLRRYKMLAGTTVLSSIAFLLFADHYDVTNSYIYLMPIFLSFAIWVGLGIFGLVVFGRRHGWQWVPTLLGIAFALYLGLRLTDSWILVDASKDMRAERYGSIIMDSLPSDAIVFTNGDRSTFAVWYFHFALGHRPDIRVVASDLLEYDWYRENLEKIYPDIKIYKSTNLTWVNSIDLNNPEHPICHTYYDQQSYLYCEDTNVQKGTD